MTEGLSRDELIEKVAELVDDQYDDYSPRYNAAGVCVSSGLAAAAVDAVLTAVADRLDALFDSEWDRIKKEEGVVLTDSGYYCDGIAVAEEAVRALLSEGGDRD